jgi:hypothetical protein
MNKNDLVMKLVNNRNTKLARLRKAVIVINRAYASCGETISLERAIGIGVQVLYMHSNGMLARKGTEPVAMVSSACRVDDPHNIRFEPTLKVALDRVRESTYRYNFRLVESFMGGHSVTEFAKPWTAPLTCPHCGK